MFFWILFLITGLISCTKTDDMKLRDNLLDPKAINYEEEKVIQKYVVVKKWGSYGLGNGQFNNPTGIICDGDNNIYVVDSGNDRIQKFTSDGGFIMTWGSNGSNLDEFNFPLDIYISSVDTLYITDYYNHRFLEYTKTGTPLNEYGSYGTGNSDFNYPTGIAIDGDDKIYIADSQNNRVQKFNLDGSFVLEWGSSGDGNGQFNYTYGVAIDKDNYIYISDPDSIQKFNSSGTFIKKIGAYGIEEGNFRKPLFLVVDNSYNIYISDRLNNRFQVFTKDDVLLGWQGGDNNNEVGWHIPPNPYLCGMSGTGNGWFYFPEGIVFDNNDYLYIVDSNNNRVVKFQEVE